MDEHDYITPGSNDCEVHLTGEEDIFLSTLKIDRLFTYFLNGENQLM